jgi:hypothetical protein
MWSPQINFPLSGSVAQDLSPDLGWFFGNIKPEAGVGSIEKEAFEIASYGRQLGLILDVLLPLAESGTLDSEKAKQSLAELRQLYERIEEVKVAKRSELEESAVALLHQLEMTDQAMLQRVLNRFRPALLTDESRA